MSGRPPVLPPAIGERPFKCAVDGCDNPPGMSGMCADHISMVGGNWENPESRSNQQLRAAEGPPPLRRFELPLPPSANVYYRHRNNPNPKLPPITHLSDEGREYQKRVAQIVLPLRHPRLQGLVAVRLAMWMEREAGDVDNRIKPLLDALEGAELFQPKPPKKEPGDRTPQKPWGDRQVALVEAYQAGISPLVRIPEEEKEAKYQKALRSWRRKVKKDPLLEAPKLSTRERRRYGLVLVEIEAYDWPNITVQDFKAEAGWE